MLPAAFFRRGEEALKAEPAGGLPGNAQRRDGGTGTGDGANDDAGFSALLDQVLPGVGDGGTARVGDQRAGLPGENAVNDPVALCGLVMLVVADKAFLMPRWLSSFSVTRVSSAAMKSALSSVSRQRREISPRLPMGVGTRYSIPAM